MSKIVVTDKKTVELMHVDYKEMKPVLDSLEKEGWVIVGSEPIEEIEVKIIGQRFLLEKQIRSKS
jgi:hypothetical protein